MNYLSQILLALFVVNLGVAFGAGLYETRIVIPLWFTKSSGNEYQINAQAMQKVETGRRFWAFVTTGPLTLLTFATLFIAWPSSASGRNWWIMAALIALIERIGTFTFFIPTLIKLQQAAQLPIARASRLAALWIRVNYLRNALTLLAWLLALKALSM